MKALSAIQRECFSNFLDDYPLVIRSLRDQPYDPADVCERAMELADLMEVADIPAPEEMCDLTKAIFKASIEKNDFLEPYEGQSQWGIDRLPEMRAAMRDCARFLDQQGIEVDHIPS